MRHDPWRDSCPDFSDLMSRLSRLNISARLCNLSLNPDAARPLARLFSRLSRLFRLKLLARIFNLGPNPDAARPLARVMSRLSRPCDKFFKVQTLGATLQFASKSGCSATLGATHAPDICPDFSDSNSRRDSAIWV